MRNDTVAGGWHWNGTKWVRVGLPLLPLPAGAKVSYSNVTAVGPKNAWLFRSISFPSNPIPVTAVMHWNGKSWSYTSVAHLLPRNTQISISGPSRSNS